MTKEGLAATRDTDGTSEEEMAFDILEAWSERIPALKAYYSKATGGIDTHRLIIAVDEGFGAMLDTISENLGGKR